jgi:hypothetical protein
LLTILSSSHYFKGGAIYDPGDQKSQVWNMIALQSEDQLRQRVAWALSQIIVVTEKQVRFFRRKLLFMQ